MPTSHACGCVQSYVEDIVNDNKNQQRHSWTEDLRDGLDLEAETTSSLSSMSDDEVDADIRTVQRLYAQRDQLKRLLAESRERVWQLGLQLTEMRSRLDASNRLLADHRCDPGDGRQELAGAQDVLVGKRNAEKRLRDANRRLKEADKTICEMEDRLSGVMDELAASRDSTEKLTEELAACKGEREDLRRRTTLSRDFRQHVELIRQLSEARTLNEQLQRKLDGGRGLVVLTADGTRRRVH